MSKGVDPRLKPFSSWILQLVYCPLLNHVEAETVSSQPPFMFAVATTLNIPFIDAMMKRT